MFLKFPNVPRLRWPALPCGVLLVTSGAISSGIGCNPEGRSCEENERAVELAPAQTVLVGGEPLRVELADASPLESSSPWAYRRCDLEGLAILPEEPKMLEVRTCQVLASVDIAFVRDDAIVAVYEAIPPCAESECERCPAIVSDEPVDAALQTLAGEFDFGLGQAVSGLPSTAAE